MGVKKGVKKGVKGGVKMGVKGTNVIEPCSSLGGSCHPKSSESVLQCSVPSSDDG